MRFERSLRHVSLCLVVAAAAACAGDRHPIDLGTITGPPSPTDTTTPPPPPPGPTNPPAGTGTLVALRSEAGDYVGAGRNYDYTLANSQLRVIAVGGRVSINVTGDESWSGDFQSPSAVTRLQPGTYTGLTRYPFNDAATGGLSWSGDGRGCNTLTGTFTVDSVTYDGDSLTYLRLTFEQHCEGQGPALRGTVRYVKGDPTTPPGPRLPVPAGTWQPVAGSTPATGDFVYLISDAGDYIGQGRENLYAEPTFPITVVNEGSGVRVSVEDWSAEFVPMNTLARLQPGMYPGLMRYPFHNPVKGGLSWSGQGRGCNTLTGWFVVDSVTYTAGVVTALDLRFEQHCEGGLSALRGRVRWTK
jgi:hypothetical protein